LVSVGDFRIRRRRSVKDDFGFLNIRHAPINGNLTGFNRFCDYLLFLVEVLQYLGPFYQADRHVSKREIRSASGHNEDLAG
jgi:hypothetical protein